MLTDMEILQLVAAVVLIGLAALTYYLIRRHRLGSGRLR
jgi:hypothetical protein